MKIVHLMAGLGATSGVANVARRFARVQRERGDEVRMIAPAFKWNPVYFGFVFAWKAWRAVRKADEVWVHCSWTFPVWFGAWLAKRYGRKLVVVPEASFDPLRMNNQAGWKKRLVAPLDRWVVRQADNVYALCPDEIGWVKTFEPSAKVEHRHVPLFLPKETNSAVHLLSRPTFSNSASHPLHVLFLGRAADPLKGVRFLQAAVEELNHHCPPTSSTSSLINLRVVSNHFGEELERDWEWADVLCLPTLSDNFGLVVAEALERGKRVITTDGAPAWDPIEKVGGESRSTVDDQLSLEYIVVDGGSTDGTVEAIKEFRDEVGEEKVGGESRWREKGDEKVGGEWGNEKVGGESRWRWDGRLIYLKGYRERSDEMRVKLLKDALEGILK